MRGARRQWIVPIDVCYALVGLIRTHWRGFTGGADVWRELDTFFEDSTGAAGTEMMAKQMDANHVKGIKQGNAIGNYERQKGHNPDGTSTAERSTGINSGARADRPADAEPVAG